MKIVVEVLSAARAQLLEVLEDRCPSKADALLAAITYCDEITRLFEEYQAPPPDAILRPRGKTGSWWLFASGVWVAFTREDRYLGLRPFRRVERTFTVLGFASRPTDA